MLRRGAPHNSMGGMDTRREDGAAGAGTVDRMQFASATEIRWNLLEGRWDRAEPYLLPGARERLEDSLIGLPALKRVEQVMLARVRTMTAEDWAALPDSGASEGLPERLVRAGRRAESIPAFYAQANTRRYTEARVRRLLLWAFLGLTKADRPAHVPYLRVLGLNERGGGLLRRMKQAASLPVITKPARAARWKRKGGPCSSWKGGAPICTACASRARVPARWSGPPVRWCADRPHGLPLVETPSAQAPGRVSSREDGGINHNPSLPAAQGELPCRGTSGSPGERASEGTLLRTDGVTFLREIEPCPVSCFDRRKPVPPSACRRMGGTGLFDHWICTWLLICSEQ